MQFYLITNTAMLKKYEWTRRYKYHLVLAQVLARDQEYFELVQTMIAKGASVILDNGIHEGVVCSLSEYYEIANELQPECIVLPDLIGAHAIESRTRSLVFYRWLLQRKWPVPSTMYVPQGLCQREIVDDFLWSLNYFQDQPCSIRIGMGNAYKYCYTNADKEHNTSPEEVKVRLVKAMLFECARCAAIETFPQMHILGGRAISSKWYGLQPNIVGIDSLDPCRCALDGQFYPVKESEYDRSTKSAFDFMDHRTGSFTMLHENCRRFCDEYGAKFE